MTIVAESDLPTSQETMAQTAMYHFQNLQETMKAA